MDLADIRSLIEMSDILQQREANKSALTSTKNTSSQSVSAG